MRGVIGSASTAAWKPGADHTLLLEGGARARIEHLLPAWAPVGVGSGGGNVNLLSQINVEEFGSLYKIMYEIRYSKVGWHSSVYTNI